MLAALAALLAIVFTAIVWLQRDYKETTETVETDHIRRWTKLMIKAKRRIRLKKIWHNVGMFLNEQKKNGK